LPALIRCGAYSEIDRILQGICGPGFTLDRLGMGKKESK